MANYTRKALFSVGIITAFTILAGIMGYIVRAIFARKLPLEDFGLFYSVLAFVGMFGIFKSLGMDRALIYYIPKLRSAKQESKIKSALRHVFSMLLATNAAFLVLIALFSGLLQSHYFRHPSASAVLIILAVHSVFDSFVNILKFYAQGSQRMAVFSSVDFTRMSIAAASSVFAFNLGYGVKGAAAAYLVSQLATFLIYFFILLGKERLRSIEKDRELSKNLRFYGLQIMLIYVGGLVLSYSDKIMLTLLRNLTEVGIYSAVFPTAMLLWYIPMTLTSVQLPLISEFWSKGMTEHMKEGLRLLYKFLIALMLPLSLALFIYSDFVLRILYGSEFAAGSLAFKVLVIGVMFNSLHMVNSTVFAGIGKPKVNTWILAIGAAANVALNIPFIIMYGYLGASITTAATYILMSLVGTIALYRGKIAELPYANWAKTGFAAALFFGVMVYLNKVLVMESVPKIAVILALSGVVYLAALFMLKVISTEEIMDILKRLKKSKQ